jgi:hypothetical protein
LQRHSADDRHQRIGNRRHVDYMLGQRVQPRLAFTGERDKDKVGYWTGEGPLSPLWDDQSGTTADKPDTGDAL